MKIGMSLVTLAFAAGSASLAQSPITAPTSNIAVTTQNSAGSTICNFAASAVSYAVEQGVNPSATGSGAGKITFNPFVLVKDVDNCSGTLLADAAAGVEIPNIFVVISPPATASVSRGAVQSTFVILLTTAALQTLSESAGDGRAIQESVGIAYGGLTIAEVNGNAVSNCHGWNRLTNSVDTAGCLAINKFVAAATSK